MKLPMIFSCLLNNLYNKLLGTKYYLFLIKVQSRDMHLPGERFSPVNRKNVAEVACDCPPHSEKEETRIKVSVSTCFDIKPTTI